VLRCLQIFCTMDRLTLFDRIGKILLPAASYGQPKGATTNG